MSDDEISRKAKYPASRVTRSRRTLIGGTSRCRDCAWKCARWIDAARAASQHVRETGHDVEVKRVISYGVRLRNQ